MSTYMHLSAASIRAYLPQATGAWAREIVVHRELESTNSHLMARAASESIDGCVCLAEVQTKGRGRRGRTWITPEGKAIAMSLGRVVAIPMSSIGPLSLVVGVAVANAMNSLGIRHVALKWPNDVLVAGSKAGGILIELAGAITPLEAVIGIGVNVGAAADVGEALSLPVGDVLDGVASVSRDALAAALIDHVHRFVSRFEADGFVALRDEWAERDAYRDRPVTVSTANEVIDGIDRGVDTNGELILETLSGVRYFSGGEVSLRGAASSA